MTLNDTPIVAFFKRLLDPFMIWGMLILLAWIYDETFTGYYLVLMIITFFISSYVYEQTNIYRTWRNGNLLVYISDTLIGWGIVISILLFLGYATRLTYRFSEEVIMAWFIATPLVLIASHLAVHWIATSKRRRGKCLLNADICS